MRIRFAFLFFLCVVAASAEGIVKRKVVEKEFEKVAREFEDSLAQLASKLASGGYAEKLMPNPRFYKLFCPPTMYSSSVRRVLDLSEPVELYPSAGAAARLTVDETSKLEKNSELEAEIDGRLLDVYLESPQVICYTLDDIMSNSGVKTEAINDLQSSAELVAPVISVIDEAKNESVKGVHVVIKKPNFWTTSGKSSLTFTQNYISGNWYQGGESTKTLISELILKANYNDKQKVQFDNSLEVKLGFTTAPSDTMHKYRTNTDVLRLSTKLGVQAITSWYYTISATATTQIMRNYKVNSNVLQSAFLAPLTVNVGLGMDYKKNWKNYTLSATMSPLAYELTFVGNSEVDEKNYGVDEGKCSKHEYGSSMEVKSDWKITKDIKWYSHFYAFTSYEKVLAYWENTFEFIVSKYLTTKLFTNGRFDDGISRKSGYNYFQFKESLSFGVTYNW